MAAPAPGQPARGCRCTPIRCGSSSRRSTWRATWYLLAYLVVGWVLFGVVLAAGIATLALAITLLGLPLLIGTAAADAGLR